MRIAGAYALVAAILAAVFAAGLLGGGYRAIERSDYMTYHVAARIVLAGDGDCLYEVACQAAEQRELIGDEPSFARGALPFNSPPWLAALVTPLGFLSLPAGFAIFTLIGLAVLAWGSWRLAASAGGPSATRALAVLFVLTAWPTVMGAVRGQSTLAVVGLLGLSFAGSGAALGLAALKPTLQPLWTLWLLLDRRWRELGIALLVVLGLILLGAVVVSPRALADYPAHLLGVAAEDALGVHPELMVNWRGAIERLGGGTPLIVVATTATLAVVLLAWWTSRSRLIAAAAAFLATPLVMTHANQHEAILAELGVLLLIVAAEGSLRVRLTVAAIATHAVLWVGPVLEAQSAEASAWLLFATILAWLIVATYVARAGNTSAKGPPGSPSHATESVQ